MEYIGMLIVAFAAFSALRKANEPARWVGYETGLKIAVIADSFLFTYSKSGSNLNLPP